MCLSSCGLVNEELEECRHEYLLRFRYDYTLSGGDAFAAQVTSVNAWLYDADGRLASAVSDSGEALKEAGYALPVAVPPGVYEVVVWAGLEAGGSFSLATNSLTPSEEDLGVEMRLLNRDTRAAQYYSSSLLTPLFYGRVDSVELTAPAGTHTVQYIDVPLLKDTNRLAVTLSQLDGSVVGRNDFSFRVDASNSRLDWRNDIADGPEMEYIPWETMAGVGSAVVPTTGVAMTEIYSLLAEMSLGRLVAGRKPELVITRNYDGVEIVRLDLLKYLLWLKGAYYADMPDQEFLDRQDDWQLTLFIDSNLDWYTAAGIYINNWTVVPTQVEQL